MPAAKVSRRTAGEGLGHTARVYVPEESHRGIVPMNHSNKDGTSSAESEEGRLRIKESAGQSNTCPTQSGEAGVSQGLSGVRTSGSLGRYSSEIRTGCANERPSGSVRGAPGDWCPYRDRQSCRKRIGHHGGRLCKVSQNWLLKLPVANYNQCESRGATMRRSSLCLLALVSCSTFSFAQQQPLLSSATCSPQAKAITVWKVGSPYYEGAPCKAISTDLKMKAKSLGCAIQVETFPAVRFADSFFAAFEKHQEPDVLVVENKGVISGITMRSGESVKLDNGVIVSRTPAAIEGIASNETVSQALEAVPRSPGGLACGESQSQDGGRRLRPHGPRVRPRGVTPRHSTDESFEQRQAIVGGE